MRYLIIFLLFCTNALSNSLILTCIADDKSYSDNIKIFGSKAQLEMINGRFFYVGDVTVTSDTYIIVGDINHYHKNGVTKLGKYRYSINRTLGTFKKILIYNNAKPSIYSGACRKTQNKF